MTVLNEILELFVFRIREMEPFPGGSRFMPRHVIGGKVEDHVLNIKVQRDLAQHFGGVDDIGFDTATVVDQSPVAGVEPGNERIRNVTHTPVFIPVGIIQGLDTAAAWDVIFCRGHLELRVVFQLPGGLHKAFAEGPFTNNDRPVEILEGSGYNFGSGGRTAVDKNNNGNFRVEGLGGRIIIFIPLLDLPLGADNELPLVDEDVADPDGFDQQARPDFP